MQNKKIPITIIKLGHIEQIIDFTFIDNISSEIFDINGIKNIPNLPSANGNNHQLNIDYSTDDIKKILHNHQCNGLCIAIMDYKFRDNFYMHIIDTNKICISISDLELILKRKNISLENFILKNIYEIAVLYKHFNERITTDAYGFVHSDTRGCLFDLNGDKLDIIYNTEHPKICNECKTKLNNNVNISILENELKNIKKPFIVSLELFIKENPLTSMAITFLISIPINLLSNYIWLKITG